VRSKETESRAKERVSSSTEASRPLISPSARSALTRPPSTRVLSSSRHTTSGLVLAHCPKSVTGTHHATVSDRCSATGFISVSEPPCPGGKGSGSASYAAEAAGTSVAGSLPNCEVARRCSSAMLCGPTMARDICGAT